MSKDSDKTYWFKPKKYGWGWGSPLTWQGWVSFGLFVAIWLLALMQLTIIPESVDELPTKQIVIAVAIIVLDVLALVYVSFEHGEKPKWRWGNKKHGRSKEP
jgi:hypothetical protein